MPRHLGRNCGTYKTKNEKPTIQQMKTLIKLDCEYNLSNIYDGGDRLNYKKILNKNDFDKKECSYFISTIITSIKINKIQKRKEVLNYEYIIKKVNQIIYEHNSKIKNKEMNGIWYDIIR